MGRRAPDWTDAEDRFLLAIRRYPNGRVRHGELARAAKALGRSYSAIATRVSNLRKIYESAGDDGPVLS